ncbi:MAG: hypothetical protein ACFWT6_16840 [Virgibacillus proomii]
MESEVYPNGTQIAKLYIDSKVKEATTYLKQLIKKRTLIVLYKRSFSVVNICRLLQLKIP